MNHRLIIALLVIWAASAAGSAWLGWDYRDGKVAQEKLEAIEQADERRQAAETRADGMEAELSQLRSAQIPKEKLITKEVTRYVQVTPADQRCTLPGTWRVRHDAAATGIPLDAEAGSVAIGSSSPVEDAAALETVADNYAIDRECRLKLEGWKRRYLTVELPENP